MVSSDSWHISVLPDKDHDHKELSVFRRKKCLLCSGSNITEIRVYHHDQFLCRAVCQELAGETVSLKDIIQARRRRKRELHKQIDQRQSLIDQLLVSSVSSSPSEEMTAASEKPPPSRNPLKRYYNE